VIPINDTRSIREQIKERPRYYTGIAFFTALFVFAAFYVFYNFEIVELEVDVSTGHSSNDKLSVHFEYTESEPVTPYAASYTVIHGCDWITVESDAKIEDCQIKPLGVMA
jgi:hypothetical protein